MTDTGQLNTAIANGTGQGILTGLIGAQGAVGVFLRAEAGSTKDNIEGAASASQIYAGGFVVAPAPFRLWQPMPTLRRIMQIRLGRMNGHYMQHQRQRILGGHS